MDHTADRFGNGGLDLKGLSSHRTRGIHLRPISTQIQGLAADWAREKLETGVFSPQLERICIKGDKAAVSAGLARCRLEGGYDRRPAIIVRFCARPLTCSKMHMYCFNLYRCTAAVYAIGFTPNATPAIVLESGKTLPAVEHDVKTGHIRGAEGIRGFGIAFPEAVVDPSGRGESAVGMWKFMRYVREQLLAA